MKLSEFLYDLPPEQIAQAPLPKRDQSRLMVLSKATGLMHHYHFYELPQFLRTDDVLVLNRTKVFPARLKGKKRSGGKVEVLFLKEYPDHSWRALVRGPTQATELVFPENLTAKMEERFENGEWRLHFSSRSLRTYLDRYGEMPLPPYIKRLRREANDASRYQTIFAKEEGAVAAPTAGFHFTSELLKTLQARGTDILEVTLHVGWGTFRPVRTENVEDHRMLPETYSVSDETAAALTRARREKRRIVAVGTTVTRALESVVNEAGEFQAGSGETALYIYPGYHFKAIDALITNFHLPDSTPLLLACAFFTDQNRAKPSVPSPFSLQRAYEEAIRTGYRFYSYGDAMLIQ